MMNKYNLMGVSFNPFEGHEIEKVVVTNESQRELWLSCILGGDDANLAYNESVSLHLNGKFDRNAFEKAIHSLCLRHEALRSVISPNGEQMIIYKDLFPTVRFYDISDVPAAETAKKIQLFIQEEIGKSFDLYEGPLLTFYLHRITEETHYLTLIIHHLIGDGWSIGTILEDLSKLYNAYSQSAVPLLEPADQISDYALEQIDFKNSEEYTETQAFWLKQYEAVVPVVNMPLDFNRPATRTYRGKRNDYPLDAELLVQLRQLSAKTGSSLVITLLAAFEVLLYHRTGETDLVVGLPAAGQLATNHLNLVGHCVNLLPLLSKINPDQPFIEYLKKRRSEIFDAYEHQKLTFGELIRSLNVKRDKSRIPLVPIVLNVDMGMDERVNFNGLTHQLFSNPRVAQTFEISLNINGSKESMMLEWAFNTQLFSSDTIDRMMEDFELLLQTITRNPQVLLSAAMQKNAPFPEIAHHQTDTPEDLTIVDLFRKQVRANPKQTAVVFGGLNLSYEQLDQKSSQVANYLISKGISTSSMVPLCIQPSLEMLIGILGILKTGAAYVPIDPELPEQRKRFIIDETTGEAIITEEELAAQFSQFYGTTALLLNNKNCPVWKEPVADPMVKVSQENLIYIIYTSGSTGNPKGVMISHGAITDYIYGLLEVLPQLQLCKSFALGSSVATDLGNTVLFGALATGAALHLFAKENFNNPVYIHHYFRKHPVDFLKIVPSHWRYLNLDDQGLFPEHVLMFGGEALPAEFIRDIKASGQKCEVVNHYGPTETTIGKLLYSVNADHIYNGTIPIGKPFSNTTVYVVDKHFNHCPIGVAGELYIGGLGLANGYLGNPSLSDQSFIRDPFSADSNVKIYKTGDLVYWLPDGNIQYNGRIDDQVKIRGNRIELGEIQNVLLSNPYVLQSAVVAEETQNGEQQLAAYIVANGMFSKEQINNYLKANLPDYMIPRKLIQLPEIPLTANGKVNRKLLPKIKQEETSTFIPPSNSNEQLISAIWVKCLGLKQVSIRDNFFELGGHSLIAIKVMVEIEKQTRKRLSLSSLFDAPTIEKLSKLLDTDQERKWNVLVPIKPEGSKQPIYLVHGGGLNIMVFKSMSTYMDADQPVYALQALGLSGAGPLYHTIEEIAAVYNSEIMQVDPEGPYLLAGYSLGGKIVYEMAKQLMASGKEVKMLGIFDTFIPASSNGGTRLIRKVFRQFRKVPFIALQFIRNPREAIWYQSLVIRRKFDQFMGKYQEPETEVFTYNSEIVRSYDTAYRAYQMKPIDINIDLFRCKKRIYYLDDMVYLGWKSYGMKGIDIHEIPGDHKTFLFPPNDKELAGILQDVINYKK